MLSFKDVNILSEIYSFIADRISKADDPDAVRSTLGLTGNSVVPVVESAAPSAGRVRKYRKIGYAPRPNRGSIKSNKYRLRRIEMNLTQNDLARRAKVDKSTIVRLEHGNSIKPDTFAKIKDILGLNEAGSEKPKDNKKPSTDGRVTNSASPYLRRMKRWQKDERAISLSGQVRDLRLRSGMTQRQLAKASGMSQNYVGGIEKIWRLPTTHSMRRIAEALGVPLSIFGDISWLSQRSGRLTTEQQKLRDDHPVGRSAQN